MGDKQNEMSLISVKERRDVVLMRMNIYCVCYVCQPSIKESGGFDYKYTTKIYSKVLGFAN